MSKWKLKQTNKFVVESSRSLLEKFESSTLVGNPEYFAHAAQFDNTLNDNDCHTHEHEKTLENIGPDHCLDATLSNINKSDVQQDDQEQTYD